MPDPTVKVINPLGTVRDVPASELAQAQRDGYRVATMDEVARDSAEREHGTMGAQAAAAGAGLLRSATFGASDAALPALLGAAGSAVFGGDYQQEKEFARQQLAGLKEYNAAASGAGEMAGYLLPTGAGGAMGRAGKAAEAAIMGRGAAGALRTGAAVLGRGALEGAMAGAGEGVSEFALSNPIPTETDAQTAERLMSVLGKSTMRGAGYGAAAAGALHLGGSLLGRAGRGLRERIGRRRNAIGGEAGAAEAGAERIASSDAAAKVDDALDVTIPTAPDAPLPAPVEAMAKAQAAATGQPIERVRDLFRGQNAKTALIDAPAVRREAGDAIANDLTKVLEANRKLRELHTGLGRESSFRHLAGDNLEGQIAQTRAIATEYEELLGTLEHGLPGAVKGTKKLRELAAIDIDHINGALDDAIARGDSAAINDISNFAKQTVGTHVNSLKAQFRKNKYLAQPVRDFEGFYHRIRDALEDEGVWGQAGAAQREINKAVTEHLSFSSELGSKFTRAHGKDQFDKIFVGDDEKLASFVSRLGNGTALDKEVLLKSVRGMADAGEALTRHLGGTGKMSQTQLRLAKEAADAARRIEQTVAKAEKVLTVENAFTLVRDAGAVSSSIGGAAQGAATVGAIIGGAPGAAIGGLIGAVAGAITNPGKAFTQLAVLQNITGRVLDKSSAAVRGIFAHAKPGGIAYALPRLVQPIDDALARKNRDYATRADAALYVQQTPEQVKADVERNIGPELSRIPAMRGAAGDTAARQWAALQKAAPNPTSPYQLGPAPTPSASEQVRLAQAKRAIADYPAVLDDVRNGTVSPATIDILREVYPAEYQRIAQQAMDEIADARAKGKTLPYAQRRALGLLLDVPVEPLQDPELVQDIQASYVTEREQRKPPPPPPRDVRSKYATGSEQTAAELED